MRNVEEVRLIRNTKNTLTLGLVAFIAPEQELNTNRKAGVEFYASVWPEPG